MKPNVLFLKKDFLNLFFVDFTLLSLPCHLPVTLHSHPLPLKPPSKIKFKQQQEQQKAQNANQNKLTYIPKENINDKVSALKTLRGQNFRFVEAVFYVFLSIGLVGMFR